MAKSSDRSPGDGSAAGGRTAAADLLLAVAAAVLVLVLAAVGARSSHQASVERRSADDQAALTAVAAGVAADLERGLLALERASSEVPGASSGVLTVDRDMVTASGNLLDRAVLERPAVAALLARARDTGAPQLGAPVELAVGPRVLLVAADHEGSDSSAGEPTVGELRSQLTGWRVAPVDVGALLEQHLPRGSIGWARADDVVLAGIGADVEALPEHTLVLEGLGLDLRAGDPTSLGLSATTAGLLAGGVVLALGAAATRMWMRRRLRQQEVDTRRAARQVALIREVAPLLQQSLDLADVLPAVAVQLSDHFGLTGVRLSAGSTSAGQVELFGLGEAPRPTVPVLTPPDRLAAGESLTLALQRAGRSVALLHVVAGRTLGESDLQSLRAITELVTAAVVNASLFASQQEAVARLRELDVLKTVFLSTASHELRTPATAIGGFATLLTASWDRFDDDRRREFAERIAANARSLNAVVQDLLDFSLLDRGGVSVVLEAVAVGPLVTGVVERLGPALPDHTVELFVEDAPEVAADVNALERVVTNLLTNAAKFSPAGSTIAVAVEPRGGGAEISVSDQGPGVPIEERARVFTRFYRGSGDAVTRTRGVGIGLSVVAELVERMGGTVVIDDAPGGGARFRVSLVPAATVAEIPEVRGATTT